MPVERNTRTLLDRPLSARSAIASLLLGMHPPRMRGALLVRWCSVFGIAAGTARVALSRMVDRGELRAADGRYELAGTVRARQPAQDWSLTPALAPWDGAWRMASVTATARTAADRAALRDATRRLRYGEARASLWVRPDNLPPESGPREAWAVLDAQCDWWRGSPETDAVALARGLFHPAAWATRAAHLADELAGATATLVEPPDDRRDADLARAFEAGAATLAHVRRDPLLPERLCPRPWPGDRLRAAYAAYQVAFARAVQEWFRTVVP